LLLASGVDMINAEEQSKEAESAGGQGGAYPELDVEELHRIVMATVIRHEPMFSAYRDIGRMDLLQEGLIRAIKVHPKFNPLWGQYTTLIYNAVHRCFMDIVRSRGREARRCDAVAGATRRCDNLAHDSAGDALAGILEWVQCRDDAGLPGGAGGDDETLEEWLAKVYEHARRVFPDHDPGRRRRRRFSPAQRAAVALLMRKRHLSPSEARALFGADPGLSRAVRFGKRLPVHQWFEDATGELLNYLARQGEVATLKPESTA
jgi:DNA-directed RNA polymerase specialized sigma24 family protein